MSDKDSHKNRISMNQICSCIEFSGPNCVGFLNNLLISDLSTLVHNKFHYTALCNPKGRIISSLWINIINDDYLTLICPVSMQQELTTFFNMRKFRLKIEIKERNIAILMDSNGEIITDSKAINDSDSDSDSDINEFYNILFGLNLPWINKENSEKFIPQHVNLDQHENIMSFTKGCYPGQEIIARMKFLGKIKKRMALVEDRSEPDLLEKIETKNQVSPIVCNQSNGFVVQVIEKLTD